MSWFGVAPAAFVALVVMITPGALVVWLLRFRGLWLWALAGPASLSVIAVASLVAPLVGASWSIWTIFGATAAIALIAFALRMLLLRGPGPVEPPRAPRAVLTLSGLVLAAALITLQVGYLVGSPENISQTFDNVFHLNAVRFILDTGNASPFHVGQLTGGSLSFYPAGWHAVVSLVAAASGSSIMVASNAVLLVSSTIIWPSGVLLLTRVLSPGRDYQAVVAGALSALLPAFPILMADFGVLYPMLLALSALPAISAAALSLLLVRDARATTSRLVIVVLGCLPGLVVAHPGAFMAFLVVIAVALGFALTRHLRARPSRRRGVTVFAIGLCSVALLAVVWLLVRPPVEARGWPTTGSLAQAIGEALLLSPHYVVLPLVVAVPFLVGAVTLGLRREARDLVPLVLFLVFTALYAICKALPWPGIRDFITGPWYNDATRLAAMLPMFAIPIAVVGVEALVGLARAAWRSGWLRWRIPAALVIVGCAYVQANALKHVLQDAAQDYRYSADAPLISHDERLLLERLPSHVEKDAVIAGSPWTGTALAYAFADRKVLLPHMLMDLTADDSLIVDGLAKAQPGGAVCAAVKREKVDYVLDFGKREVHGAVHDYPGFDDLSSSSAVQLVDRQGDARLYKIVSCEER